MSSVMDFEERYRERVVPVCPYCNNFILDDKGLYSEGLHTRRCEICGKRVNIKAEVLQWGFSTDKQGKS